MEEVVTKLSQVRSVLTMVGADLFNPEGSCVDTVIRDVLDVSIDQLDKVLELLENAG